MRNRERCSASNSRTAGRLQGLHDKTETRRTSAAVHENFDGVPRADPSRAPSKASVTEGLHRKPQRFCKHNPGGRPNGTEEKSRLSRRFAAAQDPRAREGAKSNFDEHLWKERPPLPLSSVPRPRRPHSTERRASGDGVRASPGRDRRREYLRRLGRATNRRSAIDGIAGPRRARSPARTLSTKRTRRSPPRQAHAKRTTCLTLLCAAKYRPAYDDSHDPGRDAGRRWPLGLEPWLLGAGRR